MRLSITMLVALLVFAAPTITAAGDDEATLKAKYMDLIFVYNRLSVKERETAIKDLTTGLSARRREAIVNHFTSGQHTKKSVALFNDTDLSGWDTWLGSPKKGEKAIGLNVDPDKVYTVVETDGKPAIRISGQTFGAITSKQEFENYHFSLEFKWGEKRWPPREKAVRDSGLLYHCVGEHGAQGTFWMRSQELQIQEKDCGDYWSVAGAIVDVEGVRKDGKGPILYKKGGMKFTVPSKESGGNRIVKDPDNEKPSGQWNTIELYTVGQTSVHMVNGKVVMILTGSRHKVGDKEVPLTKGKLQIQSEGAEVFYRNITIRPIDAIPPELLK